ncbi:glycosyltransferase [Actinoplanes sp. NPDC000266]
MKIAFSSLAGYGHTYPMLPLAIACREAGHDVVYATGVRFAPLLRDLGFRTVLVGMQIRDAFRIAFEGKSDRIGDLPWKEWIEPATRAFSELLPRSYATDLLPVLRAERADVVVYEAGNPGAGLAAHRLGIPAVCHSHARADATDRKEPWRQVDMLQLRAVAAEVGVDVPEGTYLLGDPYLDIFPTSLQEPSFLSRPERRPLRPLQFSEAGVLPPIAVAARRRPLIYLTLGTVVGTAPALRAAIEGLSALDADVVVATGPNLPAEQFRDLPGNVYLERWVPQGDLMPLADLAVHHGGAATTLGASGAGLPQLLLPLASDGFLVAGAVAATGAGRRLLPDGVERPDQLGDAAVVSAEAISAAAAELLTDADTRQAAKTVAEEIAAMPSPAEVAPRIEAMLA